MLKYNNTHLFTGYLKQLLSSFKLPTYKIYSLKQRQFAQNLLNTRDRVAIETDVIPTTESQYVPYLKDNKLQVYSKSEQDKIFSWKIVANCDLHNINNFKSLELSNNIYDEYTHRYLGDFLRYQRDANNLDLMCLYNCFSNEMPSILKYNKHIEQMVEGIQMDYDIDFNTQDKKYKIYMVPVKYLQDYTIAIDCDSRVEMFCGFYNKYFIKPNEMSDPLSLSKNVLNRFIETTYVSYSSLRFNDPIVYNKLNTIDTWKLLLNKSWNESIPDSELIKFNFNNFEEDLKLFIKLPYSNTSSITILEGNYKNWNDRQYKVNYQTWDDENQCWETKHDWKQISNTFVTNFEDLDEKLSNNTFIFKPITNLQLLQCNTEVNHPFADRLIEYLIGNAITREEDLEDNIKRIQKVIKFNNKNYTAATTYYGLWDESIRPILYQFMQDKVTNSIENHDLLGYVDKDVENNYKSISESTKTTLATLKDIDLYDDIYLSAKVKKIRRGY